MEVIWCRIRQRRPHISGRPYRGERNATGGVGDMSIIHAYEQYKSNTPGIGRIMIWSTDRHLQEYIEENVSETTYRRRRKS